MMPKKKLKEIVPNFNYKKRIKNKQTMKSIFLFLMTSFIFAFNFSVNAQNSGDEKLNLPGDNLNLYAVLNLFQESETIELFEKNLNAEDSKINNLDLNNDDKIDYIKVMDNVDGDNHLIVLQVAINDKENQDVAVFSVNKDENKQIHIQLIGDEELYGKEYIIEPKSAESAAQSGTPNPGYSTNTTNAEGTTIVVEKTVIVQVQTWPVITYMYAPTYVRWYSPWYWGYYPRYWNPWRPYFWDYYYGYHSHWHSHYHGHYHNSHYYRNPLYQNNYYSRSRAQSTTVKSNRVNGSFNKTYSKPSSRKEGELAFTQKNQNSTRPSFPTSSNVNGNIKPSNKPTTNGNIGTTNTAKPNITPAINNNTKPANQTTQNIPKATASKPKPAPYRPAPKPTPAPYKPKPAPYKPKPATAKPGPIKTKL